MNVANTLIRLFFVSIRLESLNIGHGGRERRICLTFPYKYLTSCHDSWMEKCVEAELQRGRIVGVRTRFNTTTPLPPKRSACSKQEHSGVEQHITTVHRTPVSGVSTPHEAVHVMHTSLYSPL